MAGQLVFILGMVLALWFYVVAGMLLHENIAGSTSDNYRTIARWVSGVSISASVFFIVALVALASSGSDMVKAI